MAETAYADMMPPEESEEDRLDRVRGLLSPLEKEAHRRVERKRTIENRWVEDLQQYHGVYDQATHEDLKRADRSQVFINLTRPKTDAMAARLEDMLFPTDDRNWGIKPTPVPELSRDAEEAANRAMEAIAQAREAAQAEGAEQDPQAIALAERADAAEEQAALLASIIDEADKRCDAMQSEIEDVLEESRYQAVARDMIMDACKIGSGVLKGPVVADRASRRWDEVEPGVFEMRREPDMRGSVRYVDPWNCFFDPDARTVEEGQGVYERHLCNKQALRRLSRQSGFNKAALRRLIDSSPGGKTGGGTPDYLQSLRDITGDQQSLDGPLHWVWEYSGPIEGETLRELYEALGDEEGLAILAGEIDPLAEVHAVIWFCEGELLKVDPYPLDSGDCLYSVFTMVRDEASIYGYGIPRMMRHQQSAYNTAWRMALDNAGLAAGPMVAVFEKYLEPVDGKWELRPRKVWKVKAEAPDNVRPIQSVDINSHLQELLAIIEATDKQIDDTTGMPRVAQGEQGSGVTKTAQGMAILMSSSNVIFRRIVKGFDDDVITPTIRRIYDWLMQTSEKAHIKGDYEVIARGSGVLLVRELQSQNLMQATQVYGGHPVYGPLIQHAELLRQTFRAQMLDPSEIVKTDDEIKSEQAAAADQEDPAVALQREELALRREDMELKAEQHNQEWDIRLRISENALEEARVRAQIQSTDKAADREMKERSLAAEIGAREQFGDGAGGAV